MINILNLDFVVVILFLFIDLILIIKPKVPLLNGVMSLLSAGVTLTTYSNLPLFPWMSLLMVALCILLAYTGALEYQKQK